MESYSNNCGYIEEYIKEEIIYGRLMDIIDGDTIVCILKIDIGESSCFLKFKCRLNGVDTYEMKSNDPKIHELAKRGREYVVERLVGGTYSSYSRKELKNFLNENQIMINVKCYKLDKYGRLLIDIITENSTLTEELISNKLGYVYHGGTKNDYPF